MSEQFKQFNKWLFDGNLSSKIPDDIDKSSSSISNLYCISLFMKCGKLNHYLNKYLNNNSIWYIPKDELFKFIKKCIKDFNVSKNNVWYYSKKKKEDKLFIVLKDRYPLLKEYEVLYLCEMINKSKDKNKILEGLGLKSDVRKQKVRKKDKKIKDDKNENNIEKFLEKNFVCMKTN